MNKKVRTTIDDNIYKKNPDGTYSAVGIDVDREYLTDGIWYVRHHDHSWRMSNGSYLQGVFEIPRKEPIDMSAICDMEDLADEIVESEEFRNIPDRISTYEYVCKIIAIAQAKIAQK